MLIRDFSKDIQSFLNSKVANIPSHESIGIDLGIKDLAICSDGNKYQNINKSQVVKKLEKKKLSPDFDYEQIKGLRKEAIQKLNQFKPLSVGQASRISGVSPADISVLLIYLNSKR